MSLLVGTSARSALAADPLQIEALIKEGVELRRADKPQGALPLFQKAYEMERSARTAAQLGLCESALGYWTAAERHLQEALSSGKHPWLIQHRREIEKALSSLQANIGELEIAGSPHAAEVRLNGVSLGILPLSAPVRVNEGPVEITLLAPGYANGTLSLRVVGGTHEKVRLDLQKVEAPFGAPAPMPAVAPHSPSSPPEPSDASATKNGWVRPAAWVAAGASGLALSVGVYGLLSQRSYGKDFDAYSPPGSKEHPCTTAAPNRGGDACNAIAEKADAARMLAIGGFVAGGSLAAVAAAGFLLSSEPEIKNREARTGFFVSFTEVGLAANLYGNF